MVKMFDYWAFHDDGSAQFFQICEGRIIDYREYADVKDAPVMLIDERTWNPDFVGPIAGLRYHGRSYLCRPKCAQCEKPCCGDYLPLCKECYRAHCGYTAKSNGTQEMR